MCSLCSHPTLWLAGAFVLILALNLYVLLTRNWEESLYPTSYSRLNYPLDVPTLRKWKHLRHNRLSLEIIWNRTPAGGWQLFVDGQPTEILSGNTPEFALVGAPFDGSTDAPLEKFEHKYRLRPLPAGTGPDLDFAVTLISASFYRTRGMHFPKDVLLVYTDLPTGNFPRHPVSYWVDDYRYIGTDALTEADRVVRDEIGVKDADDTFTRMDKVMRYLRTQLADSGGVPKDAFRWMDPWRLFREMVAGTGKGWCTQNAQIYTFFANRAGVPTRFIFAAYTQDNVVVFNGHSWAESFVREQGRWAHVDPSHSLIAIQDRKGQVLNTADLMALNEHGTYDGLTARIFKDWHWKTLDVEAGKAVNVPYAQVNLLPKTHLNRQSIIKYRRPPNVEDTRDIYSMLLKSPTYTWVNFQRYLFKPTLAYSKLPTDGVRTYALRQSLFAALVVSAALLVWSLV